MSSWNFVVVVDVDKTGDSYSMACVVDGQVPEMKMIIIKKMNLIKLLGTYMEYICNYYGWWLVGWIRSKAPKKECFRCMQKKKIYSFGACVQNGRPSKKKIGFLLLLESLELDSCFSHFEIIELNRENGK